jgi:hypothetical protein
MSFENEQIAFYLNFELPYYELVLQIWSCSMIHRKNGVILNWNGVTLLGEFYRRNAIVWFSTGAIYVCFDNASTITAFVQLTFLLLK